MINSVDVEEQVSTLNRISNCSQRKAKSSLRKYIEIILLPN